MEPTPGLTNLRTQVCVVVTGADTELERELAWPEAAEEFLRRLHKLGLQITIVGPRPSKKFGTKKTLRFMDRHEVVGIKQLEASRSHRIELRLLNSRTKAWTRLRAEVCVTVGPYGVWSTTYDGWTLPGTLSIHALSRWITEHKWSPGREFAFIGSSNQVLRWASILLNRGAKNCYVIEPGPELKCWRGHHDHFVSKGGRVLVEHKVQRVAPAPANSLLMYLDNEQGTLLLPTDTVILSSINDSVLNAPRFWKEGLFYIQRRSLPSALDPGDEEHWLEIADWRELYWRVIKVLGVADHAEAEGALKGLRNERRQMFEYRKQSRGRELGYSGKILDRDTAAFVQSSVSVPRTFARAKPVASLECFENIACRACADACPEAAIEIVKLIDQPRLLEDKCTGCGACVAICPASVAVMVKESQAHQKARYFLPDDTKELWKLGRQLQLLNRRGEYLGATRVVSSTAYEGGRHRVLEVEATNVHVWEGRSFRVPKHEFAEAQEHAGAAPLVTLKRGWVTLNGVKRLAPVDVPVTVALWQLGQRRFEDALFCHDGGCRLCEVNIDGRSQLACRTIVKEGQKIVFAQKNQNEQATNSKPLCPCRNLTAKEVRALQEEGSSDQLTCEITGLGWGTCHGRWCAHLNENPLGEKRDSTQKDQTETSRPTFHGYQASPWREIWAEDVAEVPGFEEED